MSFGEGNLRERLDKLMDVNGELCAEVNRQQERIGQLESLVVDMWEFGFSCNSGANSVFGYNQRINELRERMAALGIGEVDA